jgi:post-segregation antitoxin (ccd killing protein)
MAFIPPLFSKLGQSIKDLLTKKYDYKNQVQVVNKVAPELSFESTVTAGDCKGKGCDLTGAVKTKYKNKDFGTIEGEIDTAGKLSGELALSTLAKGVEVSVKASDRPDGKLNIQYRAENVSATLGAAMQSATNKVDASVVAGFDNFSVGGAAEYDTAAADASDYNFGSEYSQPDYTVTVKTQNKANVLVGSYFYNLPGRGKLPVQVGAQVDWNLKSNARTVTVGTDVTVDEHTSARAKVDSNANVSAAIEHRLSNPLMRIALSAQWDATKRTSQPERFGVGLTFGDF